MAGVLAASWVALMAELWGGMTVQKSAEMGTKLV
jgi:hypothetical protein